MRERKLSHVTGGAVKAALVGCRLELAANWNYEILAAEVRTALASTITPENLDPERVSNAEIKNKLLNLSKSVRILCDETKNLHSLVDDKLIRTSFKGDGFVNFIGFILSQDSRYRMFHEISANLSFMADFLDDAAENTEQQASKWRQNEQRRQSVWRGERLIPVFESAFGRKITINGWPYDPRHAAATPFMDFYRRMVKLAFGGDNINDLSGVLNEARKSAKVRMCVAPVTGE